MLLSVPEFELYWTDTVEETCALLGRFDADTRVLAGGTDLITKMKHRRLVPRRLINIKKIPGLDQIGHDARQGLRIGALATAQQIEASPLIRKKFPVLQEAAGVLGTTQIRNIGTIGGNLGNASPSAEFAPPLMVLGASVRCVGSGGERQIPLDAFFVASGRTALSQDELLTEVIVPDMHSGAHGIYLKHSLRKMDVAIASAAVLVLLEGDVCRDAKIALGAVGPTPFRAARAEAMLRGARLGGDAAQTELFDEVARMACEESFPIDDFRGYAVYRKKLIGMLVGKGLERVLARARA